MACFYVFFFYYSCNGDRKVPPKHIEITNSYSHGTSLDWALRNEMEKSFCLHERRKDILIDIHYPDNMMVLDDKKYVLYIENKDVKDCFMYLGKIQDKIYLKNYPYHDKILQPSISIFTLGSDTIYQWFQDWKREDYETPLKGNKYVIYLSNDDRVPTYIDEDMCEEEKNVMAMQPNYIDVLQNKMNSYFINGDSLHRKTDEFDIVTYYDILFYDTLFVSKNIISTAENY